MDSLDRAFDAQPALESAPRDAARETYAPPKDGILTRGSPGAERVVAEAPLEVVATPLFSTRLTSVGSRRPRMPK